VEGVREAFGWGDSADDIAEAGTRVQDCIEIAQQRFNVHPDRIFVAGRSAGGTIAHRLGMEFPERFAGAISLGGQVPRGARLLKNINRARQLPLLLSVSPTQENYSTQQVMDDLRFLHCAGLSLSLRLYPDGDELTSVMLSDLNRWVMEQFTTNGTAAVS
jgi:phospholipase/carboxylesterase